MNYGTIGMVNDYLLDQLNAVTEDGISQDELDSRLKQAKAVSDISQQIIANGKLALEATNLTSLSRSSQTESWPSRPRR